MDKALLITEGKTALGIEFGSTRVKAVLIDEDCLPLASGSYEWENKLVDGYWTYSLEEVLSALRSCFSALKADIKEKYGCNFTTTGAIGISAMMHGYLAFDKDDISGGNDYLPHNYNNNCVVYTGTHDNETTVGWYHNLNDWTRGHVNKYFGLTDGRDINWKFISVALSSVADTVVIPMQDYLELGTKARINEPSTTGMNWRWRLKQDWLEENPKLAKKICHLTEMYNRK